MKTQATSFNLINDNTTYKTKKGKVAGASLGAAAGIAYNVHDAKPLVKYINRNLDKIQAKHPNIQGNYTDVFKSYLKRNAEGKQGIVFLKNSKEVAKRAGVLGGFVAAAALAGLAIGAIADKIKEHKVNKAHAAFIEATKFNKAV